MECKQCKKDGDEVKLGNREGSQTGVRGVLKCIGSHLTVSGVFKAGEQDRKKEEVFNMYVVKGIVQQFVFVFLPRVR